ncbi:MAG TPA: selenocysteine-specific translation elongation factor, partial [Anaerolineales bacterium]
THPDRLKEEQEREMTIELGFGWLTLPDGEEVGIVDVPGHRDFIENMLAGVGGLDAALLVVAADEGVMPQTREHLAILDILKVPGGLIVLTKTDLVPDAAWLSMVEADVRAITSHSILKDAPILRVSSRTGAGLEELKQVIAGRLKEAPQRPDLGRARLPIDRVFSMSGFGTVVTGTLSDGVFATGDEVEILPSGKKARIRGLQTHRRKLESVVPGSRTAINLSGVAASEIGRGETVIHPGQYQAVRRLDAQFHLLEDASGPLRHGTEVKFFTGASEAMGRLRLLGTDELHPGEEGWVQLELRSPIVAVRGDRYILRRPSPGETLGGGFIVDHQPSGRHKRFDETMLQSLKARLQGSPAEILYEAAVASKLATLSEIAARSRLEPKTASQGLEDLLAEGKLVLMEEGTASSVADLLAMPVPEWETLKNNVPAEIARYHESFPLRRGMPREELKSRLKLDTRAFQAVLRKLGSEGQLEQTGNMVTLPGHNMHYTKDQEAQIAALLERFHAAPYSTPSIKDCQEQLSRELLAALIDSEELVPVSAEVVFLGTDYEAMKKRVVELLMERGKITLSEVRDLFGTTRKYAQAMLEHLDAGGLTVREGDFRRLRT